MKLYGAWFFAGLIAIVGTMLGLHALGARDELNVVLVIGVFALTMFIGGFIPSDSQRDRR